jgi:hypothetical protein
MRKLSELYKEEREAICKKVIDIVGTEFLLCDIIKNEAIRQNTGLILRYLYINNYLICYIVGGGRRGNVVPLLSVQTC